jgi:hypothetical protein
VLFIWSSFNFLHSKKKEKQAAKGGIAVNKPMCRKSPTDRPGDLGKNEQGFTAHIVSEKDQIEVSELQSSKSIHQSTAVG